MTLTEQLFPSASSASSLVERHRLDRLVGGPYPFLGRAIAAGSGLELYEYDVPATMERRYEIHDRIGERVWRYHADMATLVQMPIDYAAREIDRQLDEWYGPVIDAMKDYLWVT